MVTHTFLCQKQEKAGIDERLSAIDETGYKNAAGRQQESTAKVDRLQLIRCSGLSHNNRSVQGILESVVNEVFVLPLSARAFRIVQITVEGQVSGSAVLADALAGDEVERRRRIARD